MGGMLNYVSHFISSDVVGLGQASLVCIGHGVGFINMEAFVSWVLGICFVSHTVVLFFTSLGSKMGSGKRVIMGQLPASSGCGNRSGFKLQQYALVCIGFGVTKKEYIPITW
jgi:hypothetical protein